jgi:hypothetical protein
MKKAIIGLSGLVILAFVIILFTNAQTGTQEVKKAATEVSKDCSKCPTASTCTKASGPNVTETKAVTATTCDPAKCKEAKCDPATCKVVCASAKGDTKACDPAKCPKKAAVK